MAALCLRRAAAVMTAVVPTVIVLAVMSIASEVVVADALVGECDDAFDHAAVLAVEDVAFVAADLARRIDSLVPLYALACRTAAGAGRRAADNAESCLGLGQALVPADTDALVVGVVAAAKDRRCGAS